MLYNSKIGGVELRRGRLYSRLPKFSPQPNLILQPTQPIQHKQELTSIPDLPKAIKIQLSYKTTKFGMFKKLWNNGGFKCFYVCNDECLAVVVGGPCAD